MIDEIKQSVYQAVSELLTIAKPDKKDIFVVGCSSSEILGHKIGSFSSLDAAEAVFDGLYPLLEEKGLYLAAQCCEHLNRSLIIEKQAAKMYGLDIVNVIPQQKAGGSFATTAYKRFREPVAVEEVCASAGIDIGGTLIGMHLRPVAVPVRLSIDHIGMAMIICARTRPKFIGGVRAIYDEKLM